MGTEEMYSGFKIWYVGDEDYRKGVRSALDLVLKNPVGQAIRKAMDNTTKKITIMPYREADHSDHGDCNAFAEPEGNTGRDAVPEDVQPYKGLDDDPKTKDDKRNTQERWKGTGKGAPTRIHFSPGEASAKGCGGGTVGKQDDEVLIHEMIHALRMMQGKMNPIPTLDTLRLYKDQEEFLAIVITNVYMSAKKSTKLRANWYGFDELKDPEHFMDDNIARIVLGFIYLFEEQLLFEELATVHADFNPFRRLNPGRPRATTR